MIGYKPLIVKMHYDQNKSKSAYDNLELLCDLELYLGFAINLDDDHFSYHKNRKTGTQWKSVLYLPPPSIPHGECFFALESG
jgi:hypothetical protein